jgi:hypothetical protein
MGFAACILSDSSKIVKRYVIQYLLTFMHELKIIPNILQRFPNFSPDNLVLWIALTAVWIICLRCCSASSSAPISSCWKAMSQKYINKPTREKL